MLLHLSGRARVGDRRLLVQRAAGVRVEVLRPAELHLLVVHDTKHQDQEAVPQLAHLVQGLGVMAEPGEHLLARDGVDAPEPSLDCWHVPRRASALLRVDMELELQQSLQCNPVNS